LSNEDASVDISQQSAETVVPVPKQERMVPQGEVDKAIYAAKMHEREKAQQLLAQQTQPQGGVGGMQAPQFDREAVLEEARQAAREEMEANKRAYEEQLQRQQVDEFARTFLDKMKQGSQLYEDFEEVTGDVSPKHFPQIAILAGQMENTPDIMYELGKNPKSLTHLQTLIDRGAQDLARKEMTKLSQSIKQNTAAITNNVKSPSPLSKIKSSGLAGQDTGKRSIRDMRKDPKFRG